MRLRKITRPGPTIPRSIRSSSDDLLWAARYVLPAAGAAARTGHVLPNRAADLLVCRRHPRDQRADRYRKQKMEEALQGEPEMRRRAKSDAQWHWTARFRSRWRCNSDVDERDDLVGSEADARIP